VIDRIAITLADRNHKDEQFSIPHFIPQAEASSAELDLERSLEPRRRLERMRGSSNRSASFFLN
jgi:hypothetical protein